MMLATCTHRIFGAWCNGSLVPRNRGSNVPSAPKTRRCTLVLRLDASASSPAHRGERKGSGSRAAKSLSPKAAFHGFYSPSKPELSSKTPVACNTGVTNPLPTRLLAPQGAAKLPMKKITKHVDYLGMTYPDGTKPDETGLKLDWRRLERAFKGYQFGMINDHTGAVFLYNVGNVGMGAHLQLSGSALSQLRIDLKVDDYALIRHLTDWSGRASRVDLTINFHNCKITPLKAYRAFKDGTLTTPARSANYIEGVEDKIEGMTCYIGTRQSERFARVYDKNAQMKLKPENSEAWVRMELEMKKLWAKATQNSIVEFGLEAAVNSHFSDFIQWNDREYTSALDGESAPIDEIGRSDTNTEKWLLKSVVPSLARACIANPSFISTFMAAYRTTKRKIESGDRTSSLDNSTN